MGIERSKIWEGYNRILLFSCFENGIETYKKVNIVLSILQVEGSEKAF